MKDKILDALNAAKEALQEGDTVFYPKTKIAIAKIQTAKNLIGDTTEKEPIKEEWHGQSNINSRFNACQHKEYCVQLQKRVENTLENRHESQYSTKNRQKIDITPIYRRGGSFGD